jgi:hypothetical protein
MIKELGYYSCSGIVFETKLQAMLYANRKTLPIQWHFNDEKFNSYNWSIEPELTLDQLYDLRARQIREEYDYVILSYSGGSDSHNILESFLRQGLFIDEIITNWALDVSSKFIVNDVKVKDAWNNNAEFHLNTKNRLDYIKNKSPNTRITLLDTSKTILDSLLNNSNGDWVNTKNDVFNATGAFHWNPLYFSELRKRFDKLKRIAYVIGIDKPRLIIKENNLYLYFLDKPTGLVPIQENIMEYSNISTLFFYWSPNSCDLLCKQAHTVFKYIKSFKKSDIKKIWQSLDPVFTRKVQEVLLRSIIYTTWDNNWFQVNKTLQDWNCEWDYWFTKGMSDSREYAIWLDGIKSLKPKISNFIRYNNDGSIQGTNPYLSKFYYIGSMEN